MKRKAKAATVAGVQDGDLVLIIYGNLGDATSVALYEGTTRTGKARVRRWIDSGKRRRFGSRQAIPLGEVMGLAPDDARTMRASVALEADRGARAHARALLRATRV